ncbi:hypothetical protein Pmani_013759 [Petrolisthes manimaculis]|uniref:PiggyBac transposable element-derived protein domain-containing protein n=1 Tax=Petrolisthes manimaculis TaxID=1843537 RepID=A0AAE1UBU7_9EUCA|nr:hypothetical protein Pmani_013759 [Petrolisthes manimaculis]
MVVEEDGLKNICKMSHNKFLNNVEDAVQYLFSLPDEEGTTGINISLEPPDDGAESDADDPSEDIVDIGEENVNLLGARILAKPPHIELTNRNSCHEPCSSWSLPVIVPEDQECNTHKETKLQTEPPKKKQKKHKPTYTWEECETEQCDGTAFSGQQVHKPSVLNSWSDEGLTPVDVFKVFWDEEIMGMIREETNRYHQVKFGKELSVRFDELHQVFGIFLLSGYNSVPNRRLFWSRQADTRCLAVIQSGMGLNRFEDIVRSLHFVDNSKKPTEDRIFKVRPLFEHFNKKFMNLAQPLPVTWAIDEAMEPYYGRHGLKQFIRGKPVRFGYKFWCLCSTEGLLISFKLYEGKETGYEEGLTIGESVVETLSKGTVPKGSNGYIDNYFTTLPLLESFRKADINLTGTIRKDKVRDVPLLLNMKKKERGYAEMYRDNDKNIAVCQWNDNSDVKVATNKTDTVSLAMGKCKRWSKKKKEVVCLPQPVIIQQYNKGMGGVDLFDQLRGKYRVAFRKRAWYFPLFRFLLNATIVNGWLMYRIIHKVTQLDFLREIVNVLLKPSEKPSRFVPLKTPDCVRYDRTDHNIVMGETQRRCGVCKKNVKPKCTKCDVALHVQCWVKYHTKE